MSGYVRIHRSIFGHPAFRNESEAMAFAWMIGKAAWKTTRVRYKGHSISLKRGQLAISQRDMASAFERDKAWIERLWKRLRDEGMVSVDSEAGVTVVSICNYAEYQADGDDGEAPGEADARQGSRKSRGGFEPPSEAEREAVSERANNGNSEINSHSRQSGEAPSKAPREAANEAGVRQRRGTEQRREEDNNKKHTREIPLPEDWEPRPFASGQSKEIIEGWSKKEFELQVQRFKAYHLGRKSKWKDWQRAWETWVLNSVGFVRPRIESSSSKEFDLVESILAEHGRKPP